MSVMVYTVCMSAENPEANVESLESIFKSVTGEDECVITEEQKETPSHEHIDARTEEVTDVVKENVEKDGLEDVVERQVPDNPID